MNVAQLCNTKYFSKTSVKFFFLIRSNLEIPCGLKLYQKLQNDFGTFLEILGRIGAHGEAVGSRMSPLRLLFRP